MNHAHRSVTFLHLYRTSCTAYLILFFLLSANACTSSKPSSNDTDHLPITLWHALRGTDQEHLLADLKQFEQESGERVIALQLPHNAFANKLQVAIPRGNGPDLFIGAHDRVGDWAEASLIEPVSFWLEQGQYPHYVKSALEAFTYQRQLYGLPISCKALALFYNPQLVSAPKTTDELLKNVEQAKAKLGTQSEDKRLWGLAYPEVDSLYFHAPWLHAFGGVVIHDGSPDLDSPPMMKSAAMIKDLRRSGLMPPELDGALASTLFRSGRLAYLINGPWFVAELEGLPDSHWAVAQLPKLTNSQRNLRPYLSVDGVMISSHAKDQKRAWRLAKYLSSGSVAAKRLKRGELIARNDLTHSELTSWQSTFQAQINTSLPLSNHPMMKALWTPSKRALGQAIIYNAPISEAFKEAQRAVEKALKGGESHAE